MKKTSRQAAPPINRLRTTGARADRGRYCEGESLPGGREGVEDVSQHPGQEQRRDAYLGGQRQPDEGPRQGGVCQPALLHQAHHEVHRCGDEEGQVGVYGVEVAELYVRHRQSR